ncbi:MAG TPA: HEAT repeat domain-containing protein [Coleofasciculaceae cyanobacterium]
MQSQFKRPSLTGITGSFLAIILSLSATACGSSKSTEELITVLNQRGDGAYSAALALGSKKDKKAVEPLIATLQDKSPDLRKAALMGLHWFDDPRAIKAIVVALQDKDSDVQKEANRSIEFVIGQNYTSIAPALAQLHIEKSAAMEPLIVFLKEKANSESGSTQQRIITVLGHTQDARAIEPVLQAFNSSDPELRKTAIAALGSIGDKQATDALIRAFSQNNPEEQEAIALALGTTNNSRAIDTLLTAANNSNPDKQKVAIAGLGKTKDSRAVAALIKILTDPKSSLTVQARTALGNMGTTAVDPLISVLQSDDIVVRQQAAIALGDIGEQKAVNPLKKNLTDWFSNQDVAQALMKLNWQPESNEDSVHLFIAKRQGDKLVDQWEVTKKILLDDVGSGNPNTITNALFTFISLGREEVVPTLIDKLNSQGNKEMALAYLNSGHTQLSTAAEDWAKRNGYRVYKTPNAKPTVTWGGM